MTIYLSEHNDCVFESAFYLLSVHGTLKGAYDSQKKHKLKKHYEYYNSSKNYKKEFKWNDDIAWRIRKFELQE